MQGHTTVAIRSQSPFPFLKNLSVKIRIQFLSLLTIIGLLAIGGVFFWSQGELNSAFTRLGDSSNLAEGVSDLSRSTSALQNIERTYLSAPSQAAGQAFSSELANAGGILSKLEKSPASANYSAQINDIRDTLNGAGGAFEALNAVQQKIGYSSGDGYLLALHETAGAVKDRLQEEMKFGGGPDFEKLARAILAVQLAEKEFTLQKTPLAVEAFDAQFKAFEKLLKKVYISNAIKKELGDNMIKYQTLFDAYAAATADRARYSALLEDLFSLVPPHVATLNEAASTIQQQAVARLESARSIAAYAIGGSILALLILLPTAAVLIGHSVARPLSRLQSAMEALAAGQTDIDLAEDGGKTELASMNNTVLVFRDNAQERLELANAQEQDNRQREQRVSRLEALISQFEGTVTQALDSLDRSNGELLQTSQSMEQAADDVATQSDSAADAVRTAAENVTSAAQSAEELSASIAQISEQATRSTEVAQKAVLGASSTVTTMNELSGAAERIGEVMGLIRDIANQTNLLALNATIEAARAGEAGKGFAVVAAEVKQLAEQTSKATEDIAVQIDAIQASSSHAAEAIEDVSGIISDMESLASTVATAVRQQDEAVQHITANVSNASAGADEGAGRMDSVGTAAGLARTTGSEVEQLAGSLRQQGSLIREEVATFLQGVRNV